MTPQDRANKLGALYMTRARVERQIAALEAEIANELAALRRIRERAAAGGATIPKRPAAECGTDSGYYRHTRTRSEPACRACLLAHATAERERADRRKTRSA